MEVGKVRSSFGLDGMRSNEKCFVLYRKGCKNSPLVGCEPLTGGSTTRPRLSIVHWMPYALKCTFDTICLLRDVRCAQQIKEVF